MVVPELGTFANPILIEDESALPDSASNSNMIQVEEDWLRDEPDHLDSDADNEIMTTPEFYGSLTGGNIAYRGKHEAAKELENNYRYTMQSPCILELSTRTNAHTQICIGELGTLLRYEAIIHPFTSLVCWSPVVGPSPY
jgi:hypothetical protein